MHFLNNILKKFLIKILDLFTKSNVFIWQRNTCNILSTLSSFSLSPLLLLTVSNTSSLWSGWVGGRFSSSSGISEMLSSGVSSSSLMAPRPVLSGEVTAIATVRWCSPSSSSSYSAVKTLCNIYLHIKFISFSYCRNPSMYSKSCLYYTDILMSMYSEYLYTFGYFYNQVVPLLGIFSNTFDTYLCGFVLLWIILDTFVTSCWPLTFMDFVWDVIIIVYLTYFWIFLKYFQILCFWL